MKRELFRFPLPSGRVAVCLLTAAVFLLICAPGDAAAEGISRGTQMRIKKLNMSVDRNVNKFLASSDIKRFDAVLSGMQNWGKTIDKQRTLLGINSPDVKALETQYQKKFDEIMGKCEPELKVILADVKPPKDRITGKERLKYAGILGDAWKEAHPKDRILGVRFPEKTWKRKKVYEWNRATEAFEFVDRSVLMANVIVQESDVLAVMYTAYVYKDNVNNTYSAGVYTKQGFVTRVLLVSNVR